MMMFPIFITFSMFSNYYSLFKKEIYVCPKSVFPSLPQQHQYTATSLHDTFFIKDQIWGNKEGHIMSESRPPNIFSCGWSRSQKTSLVVQGSQKLAPGHHDKGGGSERCVSWFLFVDIQQNLVFAFFHLGKSFWSNPRVALVAQHLPIYPCHQLYQYCHQYHHWYHRRHQYHRYDRRRRQYHLSIRRQVAVLEHLPVLIHNLSVHVIIIILLCFNQSSWTWLSWLLGLLAPSSLPSIFCASSLGRLSTYKPDQTLWKLWKSWHWCQCDHDGRGEGRSFWSVLDQNFGDGRNAEDYDDD